MPHPAGNFPWLAEEINSLWFRCSCSSSHRPFCFPSRCSTPVLLFPAPPPPIFLLHCNLHQGKNHVCLAWHCIIWAQCLAHSRCSKGIVYYLFLAIFIVNLHPGIRRSLPCLEVAFHCICAPLTARLMSELQILNAVEREMDKGWVFREVS